MFTVGELPSGELLRRALQQQEHSCERDRQKAGRRVEDGKNGFDFILGNAARYVRFRTFLKIGATPS
jgi:hypothetical protein